MNILIVDDEIYVVEGISLSIDWKALGIENVYTAYNMKQAQKVFSQQSIDILLCDIEMPKGSGLDLLSWIREQGLETICIFLTSHANFDYANQAIRLESLDYILKPIPYDELSSVLQKAVQKVEEKWQQKKKSLYAKYWDDSQVKLMEQFWLRVAEGVISPDPKQIMQEAALYHMDIPIEKLRYCPILIQLRPVKEEAKEWESSLLEFALKNIVAEVLFSKDETPAIPRLDENLYLVVIYRYPEEENIDELFERCKEAITSCYQALPFTITCYMNKFVNVQEIAKETLLLFTTKENNILYDNIVYLMGKEQQKNIDYELPKLSQWISDIFLGDVHQVYKEMCQYLDELAIKKAIDHRLLRKLYHDFLQGIYILLDKKGLQAHMLFQDKELERLSECATHSIEDMKRWVLETAKKALLFSEEVEKTASVTETVQQYICEHLSEELKRTDIAAHVFLTPDYLSHIFKDKTGMSLTDFIMEERMREAKKMLRTTKFPIRDIALKVGYPSIPYFSKIFKRYTGMTPMEYRRWGE